MAVVIFGSSKGGVGKTTCSILLGTETALMGIPVTLIDADLSNHSLTRWQSLAPIPDNITFISDVGESNIIQLIKKYDKPNALVVVDLQGVVSRLTSRAISQADLVIVPMSDSSIDAMVGADALSLVLEEEEHLGRPVKHAVVMTRTNAPNFRTREEKRVVQVLNQNNIDLIQPFLNQRAAFKALFFHGGTLHDVVDEPYAMKDENGLQQAKINAYEFTQAIHERLASGEYDG